MELAKSSYELPRLRRMWTHLERQAGGQSKGMGEKQKEVDKRILRSRMAALRRELDEVSAANVFHLCFSVRVALCSQEQSAGDLIMHSQIRAQRKQQRIRRAEATIPVIGLCGYTNSGCAAQV